MEYLRETIASAELNGIFDLPPLLRNRRVEVIIIPADNKTDKTFEPKRKRQLGFWEGPELPNSFFDPLPEEELKAWGL